MAAYYNENDPQAAAWLRDLIRFGLIAEGEVDERSITEVNGDELKQYTQCHFFAGIGGWSYALRLAGWPDDRPVWTGSCPCQPFSAAGKRRGTADDRHLWPVFARLIKKCLPPVVFGEQVAGPDGLLWFCRVRIDLEASKYAVGAADLCAAGVGAPHIRQRVWWVADTGCERVRGCERGPDSGTQGAAQSERCQRQRVRSDIEPSGSGVLEGLGDAGSPGLQERGGNRSVQPEAAIASPWQAFELSSCNDGRTRRTPVEPAFFPLANGLPGRVAQLRGLGNAIVPQVAAEFIQAYCDVI